MALSSYERQELARISTQLTAESPRMATSLGEFRLRRSSSQSGRRILCVVAVLLGLALWLFGVWLGSIAAVVLTSVGHVVVIAAVATGAPSSWWPDPEWWIYM
jgi:hypothetical protein